MCEPVSKKEKIRGAGGGVGGVEGGGSDKKTSVWGLAGRRMSPRRRGERGRQRRGAQLQPKRTDPNEM